MLALGISSLMFGAAIYALVALQQCFQATDQYSRASSDEQRAMDYVSRDLRGAYTVTLSSSNQALSLTLPDYYGGKYDSQGNPTGSPVAPSITNGVVNYGNSAQPLTVLYYVSGQNLIRQMTVGSSGSTSQVIVSSNVENLQTSYIDLTSIVQLSVTFMPTYLSTSGRSGETSIERAGTVFTATESVRNVRRD